MTVCLFHPGWGMGSARFVHASPFADWRHAKARNTLFGIRGVPISTAFMIESAHVEDVMSRKLFPAPLKYRMPMVLAWTLATTFWGNYWFLWCGLQNRPPIKKLCPVLFPARTYLPSEGIAGPDMAADVELIEHAGGGAGFRLLQYLMWATTKAGLQAKLGCVFTNETISQNLRKH